MGACVLTHQPTTHNHARRYLAADAFAALGLAHTGAQLHAGAWRALRGGRIACMRMQLAMRTRSAARAEAARQGQQRVLPATQSSVAAAAAALQQAQARRGLGLRLLCCG